MDFLVGVVDIEHYAHVALYGAQELHHIAQFVAAGAADVLAVNHLGGDVLFHAIFEFFALRSGDARRFEVQFAIGEIFVEQMALEFVRLYLFAREFHHESIAYHGVAHAFEVVLHCNARFDAVDLAHAIDGVGIHCFISYLQGVVSHHCLDVFHFGGVVVARAFDHKIAIYPHAYAYAKHYANYVYQGFGDDIWQRVDLALRSIVVVHCLKVISGV